MQMRWKRDGIERNTMHRDQLSRFLRRLFKGGMMRRLPRQREERMALLALSVVHLDPEGIFDEAEINRHLIDWLDGISAPDSTADYVTLRRQLVDHGFLRRASDGLIYRVRAEPIAQALGDDARGLNVKALFAEVQADRSRRDAAFRSAP